MKEGKLSVSTKKKLILFILGILLIIIDQILKIMSIKTNISLFSGTINYSYFESDGFILNLFHIDLVIVMVVTAIILGFISKLIIYYFKEKKFIYAFPLVLILAGGFSNLLDRFLNGYVVDYLRIISFSFPSFNISDILIVLGIIILFVLILRDLIIPERKRREKKKKRLQRKEEKKNKK